MPGCTSVRAFGVTTPGSIDPVRNRRPVPGALDSLRPVLDETIARPLPRVDRPEAAGRSTLRATAPRFELIALAALLLATAAFGRGFSQIELGFSWLYPTEVVLGLVLVVAVARGGPRQAWARIASTGVAVPLAVLWLLGGLATARGLVDWGFSLTIEDIGLVEYSLLIPIVALIVVEREQLIWLTSVLGLGGILAIAVQAVALWTPLQWDIAGELNLIAVATGMYVALYVARVLSRLAGGTPVARWHYPVATLGVGLVVLGLARAAWLALIAAIVLAVVLALPGRRMIAAGAAAAALVLGVAFSIPAENISFGEPPATSQPALSQTSGSSGPGAANEISASFDPAAVGGQNANSAWRLAYWGFAVEQAAKQPLNGVGFGKPANFTWSGVLYDSRTGDPADPHDVTPPHNSFMNVLYRMGVLALFAVVALLVIAAWRLLPIARRAHGEDRAVAIWLLAAVAITFIVANFSVALEGPFMGIFFWTVLGLALLAPRLLSSESRDAQPAPRYAPRP